MSQVAGYQDEIIAKSQVPGAPVQGTEKELYGGKGSINVSHEKPPGYESSDEEDYDDKPSDEELRTLPRVSGKIHWAIYTIAFAELCERFSYYGSSVLYTNFVQRPLPPGSTTGAPVDGGGEIPPGALNMGQRASQGISLFNQFWAYFMPLFG